MRFLVRFTGNCSTYTAQFEALNIQSKPLVGERELEKKIVEKTRDGV